MPFPIYQKLLFLNAFLRRHGLRSSTGNWPNLDLAKV